MQTPAVFALGFHDHMDVGMLLIGMNTIAYRCRAANFSRANFRAAARTFSGGVGDGIERTMLCTSFGRRAVERPASGVRGFSGL